MVFESSTIIEVLNRDGSLGNLYLAMSCSGAKPKLAGGWLALLSLDFTSTSLHISTPEQLNLSYYIETFLIHK
jgi:hypothetical protein